MADQAFRNAMEIHTPRQGRRQGLEEEPYWQSLPTRPQEEHGIASWHMRFGCCFLESDGKIEEFVWSVVVVECRDERREEKQGR